jgi:hypothetical protein
MIYAKKYDNRDNKFYMYTFHFHDGAKRETEKNKQHTFKWAQSS